MLSILRNNYKILIAIILCTVVFVVVFKYKYTNTEEYVIINNDNYDDLNIGKWHEITDEDMSTYYSGPGLYLKADDLYKYYPDLYTYIGCGIVKSNLANNTFSTSYDDIVFRKNGDLCVFKLYANDLVMYAYINYRDYKVCISSIYPKGE